MTMTMATNVQAQGVQDKVAGKENLPLAEKWDKTFQKSGKVEHEKVTFVNRFGITLAADVYRPIGQEGTIAGTGCQRTIWSIKGAVKRLICHEDG